MTKPLSKAAKIRQANRMLLALLKTPKTRSGLIAAVTTGVISKNYIYGWLAAGARCGTLTKLKSMGDFWYQITQVIVAEVPTPGVYPSWLDPRTLPVSTGRIVVLDGVVIRIDGNKTKNNKAAP